MKNKLKYTLTHKKYCPWLGVHFRQCPGKTIPCLISRNIFPARNSCCYKYFITKNIEVSSQEMPLLAILHQGDFLNGLYALYTTLWHSHIRPHPPTHPQHPPIPHPPQHHHSSKSHQLFIPLLETREIPPIPRQTQTTKQVQPTQSLSYLFPSTESINPYWTETISGCPAG